MAEIKKNQLANIIFPMVDSTDFASLESGITASDFNSAATKKFYGVTHGNSTAFTSGTISKAASLVRSGIFQQTLKASETNYDYVMYRFTHPSCADQLLVFQTATYDDSDIYSQLSDVHSDLLSYLVGISAAISDVDSQLLLNASMISDAYSLISDVDSQLLLNASMISDVDSQLLLNASMVSDVQSALDSQFAYLSAAISDAHSDLGSQIAGVTASITASDMSDIASRVWATAEGTRVDSRILVIQSMVSDVDSQLLLNASAISDVESALDSQFTYLSGAISDAHSDLGSQIGGVTASIDASDMSDIASRVWATTEGTRVDSRILVIQSMVSDVDSQLLLNASVISDVESALDSQFTYLSGAISDAHSDLGSQIGGVTASIDASDMSDIASRVWATAEGTRVDSRILVLQSNLSDVDSQLTATTSTVSDVYSLLSDLDSNFQSRVTKKVATDSQLSDLHSDLLSYLSGMSGMLSDVDSQVLLNASVISDVDSQVLLNASVISDVYSLLSDLDSDVASRINTQVLDVLNTDTFAEPGQGAPAATATLAEKIGYIYKLVRNRVTQDESQFTVYADDGTTVDHKAPVSDDGNVFDRGELISGP